MSSFNSGVVKYPNYKGSAGGGRKNRRKSKESKIRKEQMLIEHMRKRRDELQKTIEKNKYAKEAREWETMQDFL